MIIPQNDPVQRILSLLKNVKPAGKNKYGRDYWIASCPAHDDRTPSLIVGYGEHDDAWIECRAGCGLYNVIGALGLSKDDLYPDKNDQHGPRVLGKQKLPAKPKTTYTTLDAAIKEAVRRIEGGKLGPHFEYHNPDGTVCFVQVRINEPDGGKQFRPITKSPGGWVIEGPAGLAPLYRANEVADKPMVIVAEGEKCVERFRTLGFAATTSAFGSQSAHKSDWSFLSGKVVPICRDNDDAGRKYRNSVTPILLRLNTPASIKWIDLPDLPEGGDVVDFVEIHGEDEARRIIGELIEAAPWYAPGPSDGVKASPPVPQDTVRAPIDPDRARIESLRTLEPIPLSQLGEGDGVTWTWRGYLARMHTTLLTGLWKAGKTTMLAHLLKAFEKGGDLAGAVEAARVLVISEESPGLWVRRRDDLCLGDHVHVINRPFMGRPRPSDWVGLLNNIAEWVQSNGYGVVIFDTIASLWPVVKENEAGDVLAALSPLNVITATGAAVLIVHHPRKGDGDEGQASRGSGALPGFVDIIVELRRFDRASKTDRRRVLTGLSRLEETPAEVVIELGECGYRTVGCQVDAKRDDRHATIETILPTGCEGWTVDEVLSNWPDGGVPKPGRRTAQGDLKDGVGKGRWYVSGAGTKGDPHRFSRADSIPASPPF